MLETFDVIVRVIIDPDKVPDTAPGTADHFRSLIVSQAIRNAQFPFVNDACVLQVKNRYYPGAHVPLVLRELASRNEWDAAVGFLARDYEAVTNETPNGTWINLYMQRMLSQQPEKEAAQ